MNYTLIMLDIPVLVSDEFDERGRKIIAGFFGKPKLDLSLIAEEIGWVDVEKLALNSNDFYDMKPSISNDREGYFNVKNFIEGFKASQSINKYSNNDLASFAQFVSHNDWVYLPSKNYWVNEEQEELEQKLSSQQLINIWLQQRNPKEYLVEVQTERARFPKGDDGWEDVYTPKITNNTITVTKILK